MTKIATVLAFERKISVSDGLLTSGVWENRESNEGWKKITVLEKSVRGTISNRIKATKDIDEEIKKSNPQTVDFAALNLDDDSVKLTYNVRVIGQLDVPTACNDFECLNKIKEIISDFKDSVGFSELGKRYAYQILSGRPLWRNRVGAEEVVTVVTIDGGNKKLEVNSLNYNLKDFDLSKDEVIQLGELIAKGLAGESYVEFKVESYAKLGKGQEVYPSQEMVLDSSGNKSKYLYSIDSVAAMHSQKIGNAIRTIDTWYDDYDKELGPIPVEPYGSVTTIGKAFRPKKTDFYTLFDNWITKDKVPSEECKQYVIAMLIRGGVFGSTSK